MLIFQFSFNLALSFLMVSFICILFLVEKSLGKKIVCLVVCPQGQKNIFYWKHKTLVSCVECWSRDGRWHGGGVEMPPPLPLGSKEHTFGVKKTFFLKNRFFASDVKKSVLRVKERFCEKNRLMKARLVGHGRVQRNIFHKSLKISIST